MLGEIWQNWWNCTTTKRLKELKIAIEVFHLVFGAVYQDHIFKFKSFYYSLHSNSGITPTFEILLCLYDFLSWNFIFCSYWVIRILNFERLAWEKPPIAASPVFSLFYVVLIPTYFENLGHLQLEGLESSKILYKILVAKKKKRIFFSQPRFW